MWSHKWSKLYVFQAARMMQVRDEYRMDYDQGRGGYGQASSNLSLSPVYVDTPDSLRDHRLYQRF